MAEDCLMVHLKLSDGAFGTSQEQKKIREFAAELEECVARQGAGEFDGDEFGGGECTLYFYGPNADKLLQAVSETIKGSVLSRDGFALRQYDEEKKLPDLRTDFSKV